MDWAKYFDRIYCIHYVEYTERKPVIEGELRRIGILGSSIFEWRYTYRNEFEKSLAVRLGVNPQALIGSLFIETKRIIAESLYKGYRRILIIEDDAVFLKDISEIERMVGCIPPWANLIQYDKRTDGSPQRAAKWNELVSAPRDNAYYVRADGNVFWGGACYAITAEGMKALDRIMSKDLINSDNCFAQVPGYAIAVKNICLQGEYLKSERVLQGVPPDIDRRELSVLKLDRNDYSDASSIGESSPNGEDVEIPWGRWFDKVYCLHYLPDAARMPRLKEELTRVGLWNSPLFEMRNMVSQKMEEVVLSAYKSRTGSCRRLFEVGIGMENIRVMKEAILLGYKRIMVIEDDVAFLKDKREIVRILDAMPDGFGIVQMDKAVFPRHAEVYRHLLSEKRLNEYFVDSGDRQWTLSTCNVYTRAGMEKMTAALEERMGVIDTIMAYIPGEPALAVKNLAVQVVYGDCHNKEFYDKAEGMHSVYESYGLDYSAYAVPDGYGYGKVVGMEDYDDFRVSVYAIALNEERLIRRWYDCFKEADEVVVLDTGSTDRTVEILQSLGAKVKTAKFEKWKSLEELDAIVARGGRPWRFDDARNQAMSLCDQSSTLLFCSDIDDVIEPGWKERLRIAWQKGCEEGAKTGHKPNAVLYTYSVVYQKDGREIEQEFVRHGIHVPGKWRWHSRCHEYLEIEDGPKNFVHCPEFKMKSRPEVKNHSSYLVMLEADAREGSPDGRAYHLLGREYMQHRRADEALAMFHKYLSCRGATWKNERAATMKFISDCYSLKQDEARQELWLWKAMNEDPTDRDAPYVLGRMLIKHKEFSTAVSVLEKCIAVKKPNHDFPMFSLEAWTERPYLSLAEAYFYNGQLPQALTAAKMALENNPDSRMAQITVKEIEDALANAKENIVSKPCFRIELPR